MGHSAILNNSQVRMSLEELLCDVTGDSMCIGEGSKALASLRALFADFHDKLMDMYSDDAPSLSTVVLEAECFLVTLKDLREADPIVAGCLSGTSTGDAVYNYFIDFCTTCNLPKAMPERLWTYIDPLGDFS